MQQMENNRNAGGPRVLDGVRVLDFTAVIAGSYCTRMLADLGAEVLKVENPGGEILRHAGPLRDGTSALYAAMNSGKRCLSLDLKKPAAVDICRRLAESHDVVVENFSPGVMQRLGLDYPTLCEINPRLVMCSVSGYGQTGPEASRPAYAPIVQATSGYEFVYLRSQPGLTRPLNMGLPIGDTSAAQQAFGAICAALFYRERTGRGQYIDIAMQDVLVANMHKDFQTAYLGEMNDRHYGPLATTDGYVIVIPLNQHHFEALADLIGRPHLLEDPKFATISARIHNYDDLQAIVETWTRTHTSAEAIAAFEARKLPCAHYRHVRELEDDPQLRHRGMITEIEDEAGPLVAPNAPFLFSDTHAAVGRHVPRLGEHNRETLGNHLGMSDAEIAALEAEGVVGPSPAAD